ncbi:MAG: hypothetical protein AB7O56_15970, partial [Bauldia sp.]
MTLLVVQRLQNLIHHRKVVGAVAELPLEVDEVVRRALETPRQELRDRHHQERRLPEVGLLRGLLDVIPSAWAGEGFAGWRRRRRVRSVWPRRFWAVVRR